MLADSLPMAVTVTVPAVTVIVNPGTAGQVSTLCADAAAASKRPENQILVFSIMNILN